MISASSNFCIFIVCLVAQLCPTLCDPMDCSSPGSSLHGDSPGKNTGGGCHFLLQGIFLTQGLDPCLLHWQAESLPLAPPGKPTLASPYMGVVPGAAMAGGAPRDFPGENGLPFPSPGDLPDPGIGPRSPTLQAGT